VRQLDNQQLGVARSLVARFPKRLQELVGYGIYHGLIGHIDKRPPRKLLRSDADKGASLDGSGRMLWDALD
jgi:ectoine hydroxylase-related dioxygenase (phytanoyl-CoA dioxygenase family)